MIPHHVKNYGKKDSGEWSELSVSDSGTLKTSTSGQSSYGDNVSADFIPQIAGNCVYGFVPSNFREFTASGGSVGAVNQMFEVDTGTTVQGYGAIQSFRTSNYKVGQGMSCRFSAIFPDVVTSGIAWHGCGFINLGDELSFGYHGRDFGIWHRYGGKAEIQTITVTGAASGTETATVTIDGTAYSVDLTNASGDADFTAYEIAKELNADVTFTAWEAEQLDDTVVLVALSDGNKTGSFSFSSSTATATFAETTAGVTKTSHFYPQTTALETSQFGVTVKDTWNGAKISIDPSKGNNYIISFKDGFGNMDFFIEDPSTSEYVKVHTIRWGNANTQPNLGNPSLRAGLYAASVTSTESIKVQCSDIAIITQGSRSPTRNPRSVSNTKSIATTLTNIFTLRNSRNYNGFANQVELQPKQITLTNDGTKNAIFQIRGNATVDGQTNFSAVGTNLVSELDTTGGTVTENGRPLGSYSVAKGSSLTIDLMSLEIAVPPTLRLVVAGKFVSGSASDLSASLVYYEDV